MRNMNHFQNPTRISFPVVKSMIIMVFYYNATPEATPTRPMARPPTPKFPATAADPRSTISPARRHDPPRWGRAGPTGTCTPMGAPPEGETRGGTEGPRQPWGASVVIPPAGPGRQGQWARAGRGGHGQGGGGRGSAAAGVCSWYKIGSFKLREFYH